MKLLPDENIPKRLKVDFPNHEVYPVRERGWNGIRNGVLLKLMLDNGFDALVTFEKNATPTKLSEVYIDGFRADNKRQHVHQSHQAVS